MLESIAVDDRRRSATIRYGSEAAATAALREMNGNMVNGVTLRVSRAQPQGDDGVAAHPWAQPPPSKAPKTEPPSRSLVSYEDNPF